MITRLLIANRGEIACRIAKTAKKMAIHVAVIFEKNDAHAQHVKQADQAFAVDNYCNAQSIIEITKTANIDAIHPGYGFLAEDGAFAQQCENAGIIFIGPPSTIIKTMADKTQAKQLMAQAGIPVIPQYSSQKTAKYPLLIKASNSGGGKGIRCVTDATQFSSMLQAVKREAKPNDTLLLEKWISEARHVEIQIMGDPYGNIVHLFSRDCSIQRRHQKIIEEAPAPNLPRKLLEKMAESALSAAKALNYQSAGTFEFLVDNQNHFYFMEMNTRLQVEHPVTEMVTGIDLVEWQIRIANGEKLPLSQAEIHCNGHAIETRLCAEDPSNDFMPTSGTLQRLQFPKYHQKTRIDSGFVTGDRITPHYDSLIAKIIAWGETRDQAIHRLSTQLANTYLIGIANNNHLLNHLIAQKDFQSGQLNTEFIKKHPLNLATPCEEILKAAAFAEWQWQKTQSEMLANLSEDKYSPWFQRKIKNPFRCYYHGNVYECAYPIKPENKDLTVFHEDSIIHVFYQGIHYPLAMHPPSPKRVSIINTAASITALLSGTVVVMDVSLKKTVNKGDPLLVLEAMKMQHTITAPYAGTVTQLRCAVGDFVAEGYELLQIKPH